MDDAQRRLMLIALENLAGYVRAGGAVELSEPAVRGRKGPEHSQVPNIGLRIWHYGRYNALCWERMKRGMNRKPPSLR